MPFLPADSATADLTATVVDIGERRAAPAVAGPKQRRHVSWRNLKFAALGLACVLVAANTLVEALEVRNLRHGYSFVQDSQDALTALHDIDTGIREMSYAEHQFLLTNLPQFVGQYRDARQRTADAAGRFRALTVGRPDQQRSVEDLDQRLASDAAALDAIVALDPPLGDTMLRDLLGRPPLAEAVRPLIGDLQQAEWRQQAARIGEVQHRTNELLGLSGLRTLASIAMIGLMIFVIRRDTVARRALAAERTAAMGNASNIALQVAAERRKAEQEMRGQEMMLRGLSDAIPQIAFILRDDGSGEFTNRRWYEYTGAATTFSATHSWNDLVHRDDLAAVRLRWRQTLEQAVPFIAEFRLRGRNGQYRWFLAHAMPAGPAVGQRTHWAGTLTDIDDIRHADAALRASETRFRRIFEGSPFGITLSEGQDRRILQANPAFCQMLGYTQAEMVGRSLTDLTHPDDRQRHPPAGHFIAADPAWRVREKRYLTKQGIVVWASIRVVVFNPPAAAEPQFLAVVEDISRQRDVDEALRQAQRMEAVGQLSGGLAHDFNNLLGVIIGNIECLLDTLTDDPERAELAQEVLDSALGGAELTRRLLAFGRRQTLSPQRIDLSVQVPRHVVLLSRTLGPMIQVETIFAEDLWPTRADPSQLGDALLNLALNARDAMPHGGVLTIETYNDTIGAEDAAGEPDTTLGDYVVLAVSDTGIGMPPHVRARAVEPFFTTKGPGVGSGLGLSMIYGFVRQSGGFLRIGSEVGIGTTVRIFLPRTTGQEAPVAQEAPDVSLPTGYETILVVDDSPEMRQVAERHLRFLGYAVLTAENGSAALTVLRAGTPVDLLFTDIAMPDGLNGFQLADAARQLRPGLKVMFTTGYAGTHDPYAPPDWQERLIRKPYRRPDLAEKIRGAFT
jgi:PAS domain S-box-containing protein